MCYFKIRPEHFRLPDTTPDYAVYRFRHPGGKMDISVVDEKTDQTWVLEDLFIYEMLRHFELELMEPGGEEIIDYCIEQGVIPFPYEVYVPSSHQPAGADR